MTTPAITLTDTIDTIGATEHNADTPTPLKERAWALYCQGLHSPAISEQLGVSERTVRHWISRITDDLDAQHDEQRQRNLLLAIERKRHISIAAWDGYERASDIAKAETAHALQVRDEVISTACVRASRHALTTAVRYLKVVVSNDRDLTALTSLHDDACLEHERAAREQEEEQERKRDRQAWERERQLRAEARRDREYQREREPQPPPWLDPDRVEMQWCLYPDERLPEVNAYYAALDAHRAARQAADDYARVLAAANPEGIAPDVTDASDVAATTAEEAAALHSSNVLAALTPKDIAALQARLDAEETEDAANEDVAYTQSELEPHKPSPLTEEADARASAEARSDARAARSGCGPQGGQGERSEIENAAKTATVAIAPTDEIAPEVSLCS